MRQARCMGCCLAWALARTLTCGLWTAASCLSIYTRSGGTAPAACSPPACFWGLHSALRSPSSFL